MTLSDRPDPGPRCDPADVEIWKQLQRALTKLDQAEQREGELRRERNEARGGLEAERKSHEHTRRHTEQAEAQLGQATEERDKAKVKLRSELERKLASMESMAVQRDALAEALSELAGEYGCTLLEPADPSLPPVDREACRDERPNQRQTWCYACIARSALDALDQTNREVKP